VSGASIDTDGDFELVLPADPALALTTRMFAGAVARQAGVPEIADDLKLAFSELFAAAVESGDATVHFRVSLSADGTAAITVTGDGPFDAHGSSADEDDPESFARSHRMDLLLGMFPSLHVDGVQVRFGFATQA
jgi:hypothetical protein